ncbi:MAG: hypothetical protein ABIQ97_05230 [Lysobacteraceae bacterium]
MRNVTRNLPSRSICARRAFIILLLAGSLTTISACASSMRSAHKPHPQTIRVTVLDSATGKPIAAAEVSIHSDNGVRCIQAPCPTNAMDWKGFTDAAGMFKLPKKILQQSTTITATGHSAGKDLLRDASKPNPGEWVIELEPDR